MDRDNLNIGVFLSELENRLDTIIINSFKTIYNKDIDKSCYKYCYIIVGSVFIWELVGTENYLLTRPVVSKIKQQLKEMLLTEFSLEFYEIKYLCTNEKKFKKILSKANKIYKPNNKDKELDLIAYYYTYKVYDYNGVILNKLRKLNSYSYHIDNKQAIIYTM